MAMTTDTFPTLAFARPNATPEMETLSNTHAAYTLRSPSINRSPKRQQSKHGKGLSLSFPILLPLSQSNDKFLPNPRPTSPLPSAQLLQRSPNANDFLTNPTSSLHMVPSPNCNNKPGDFLTKLAAQERKVLELKEELGKAEIELRALKKQWAAHEAGRKKNEAKNTKRLQQLTTNGLSGLGLSNVDRTDDKTEDETKRRKALMEMSYNASNMVAGIGAAQATRRGSKRVFEGRHTRALSLLSPPSQKHQSLRTNAEARIVQRKVEADQDGPETSKGIVQMSSLEGIMSTETLVQGLGKTYMDLAARRRSLPPVAADLLVKQGKQMVDGVREGLWTFFEDIRQATVGEEGGYGTSIAQQPQSARPDGFGRHNRKKVGTVEQSGGSTAHLPEGLRREYSFWSEFGLETPERKLADPGLRKKRSGHMQKKGSTDSQNPPDLLIDVGDVDEDDEDWESWTTPASPKHTPQMRQSTKTDVQYGEALSWPEPKKLTPSKLTRTVSDLMRDWEGSNENLGTIGEERRDQMLSSPHI